MSVPTIPSDVEITRIDFHVMPNGDGVRVMKYTDGARGPFVNYLNPDLDLTEAKAWLEDHGWKIRTWKEIPGGLSAGMRAWRYEIKPIRDRSQIWRRRDVIMAAVRHAHPNGAKDWSYWSVDLAFDG